MAFVNLRHSVAAPITSRPAGGFPVYGTGFVVGRMMSADVTLERDDAELRGDGNVEDTEKGLLGAKITLGVTDLTLEVTRNMLGSQSRTAGGVSVTRDGGALSVPELGYGYYRVRRVSGVRTIRAYWYYRTQWAQPSENAKQRDKKTEFQTPTIEGNSYLLDDEDETCRDVVEFSTEAAAIAWLDEMANIGEPASKTALNAAITAAQALDPETYTSASWVAVANALATAVEVAAMTSPSQTRVDDATSALTTAVSALEEPGV